MWWSLDWYVLLFVYAVENEFVGHLLGIISACELLDQLAHHRVLPGFFLNELHMTKAPYVSILFFVFFCGVLYASASAELNVVSQMSVSTMLPNECYPTDLYEPGSRLYG